MPQRTKPHYLPAIVEDERAALGGTALFRGDEYISGSRVVRTSGHLDDGRAKVGARTEGQRAPHGRGRSVLQGLDLGKAHGARLRGAEGSELPRALERSATNGARQGEVCGTQHRKEASSREPRSHRGSLHHSRGFFDY